MFSLLFQNTPFVMGSFFFVFLYLVFFGFFFTDFFFLFFIIFFFFIDFGSWFGSFFILDPGSFSLFVLSVFTFLFVKSFSISFSVLYLSSSLVLLSFFFFSGSSFFWLFILLESSLVPLIVLLLGFGSQVEKISASYYLVLYATLCGFPFFFFCSICYDFFGSSYFFYYTYSGSFSVFCLSLLFFVKFPLYGLHLWLPKVHVEAPSEASILLASLLLKMGTYGFTRVLSFFCWDFYFFLEVLCLLGMVLTGFICCLSSDSKIIVAYSSVSHMMFLLYTLLSLSSVSSNGGVLLMVSHGYVSILLFYIVGELYSYWGVRVVYFSSSLWSGCSLFSVFVLFAFLSNAGVPPFMGFFGEVLSLVSLVSCFSGVFFFLFFYYVLVFYYSLGFSVSLVSGKEFLFLPFFLVFPFLVSYLCSIFFLSFLF